MKLIHGISIKSALRELCPSSIAVAYVGADWATYVDATKLKEIVLSPTIGSNPFAIMKNVEQLQWDNVYFLDCLHAKIYLSSSQAAVGSFNLTHNGLSAEALDEAGFIVDDLKTIEDLKLLVESYKVQARLAYPDVRSKLARVGELRAAWDRAVKNGIIRNDSVQQELSAYRPITGREIYVCCVWRDAELSEEVASSGTVKDLVSFLETDNVECDRWILCWYARADGRPDLRHAPYWLHVDEVVSNGAINSTYTKIAVERNDRSQLAEPFTLTEEVSEALRTVLSSGRFPDFLGNQESWSLNPTLVQLPDFFAALQTAYKALTPNAERGVEDLRQRFAARIREAMDIALQKRYVTHSIEGMLQRAHSVEVAKQLVKPGSDQKSGLKKLAKANALDLAFESIMLEEAFQPLFTKNDLACARFNLSTVNKI